MEMLNTLAKFTDQTVIGKAVRQEALEAVVLMLAPIVPHICHTLWQELGHEQAVVSANWPIIDEVALKQDSLLMVVQVNGKLRGKITVATDASHDEIQTKALNETHILKFIDGKTVRKVIVVPNKLINIVI
jgi:leucyl-tRNA synthetase